MAEDSLKQSMDVAVKRYSSLFRLPSSRKVLLLLTLSCVGGGTISVLFLRQSLEGLMNGTILGVGLFVTALIADYAMNAIVLKRDTIYDLRRTVALSLFCWVLWFSIIFFGMVIAAVFDLVWWIRFCLLGFSAASMLRMVVFCSTTAIRNVRLATASLAQPLVSIFLFLAVWNNLGYSVTFYTMSYLVFSIAVSYAFVAIFLSVLDSVGRETVGVRSLSLFRSFMFNWVLGENAQFEEHLEKLGETSDVKISLMKFVSSKNKAIIVTPSIHPGPFKNIGSSLLPSLLKAELEKQFDCIACVPHGVQGHEFDLASQRQNRRVIDEVIAALGSPSVSSNEATAFVRVSNGVSTAGCQIFGGHAFVSFTLAPSTIEDIPQELGIFVCKEAERLGFDLCTVVNAHNSINGSVDEDKSWISLKQVAIECLKKAASMKQLPFEAGAATAYPKEFSLKDGMGAGGITVIVAKVGTQKTGYVVIDGNNMISGLRERIIESLRRLGIDESEVFTTDTHSVNALVLNRRGYHPVGESTDNEKLMAYIEDVALAAVSNLRPVRVESNSIKVKEVKVIGEKQLEMLCLLIDRTLQKAKKYVVPVFAASGLLLMLFLLFV